MYGSHITLLATYYLMGYFVFLSAISESTRLFFVVGLTEKQSFGFVFSLNVRVVFGFFREIIIFFV